MTEVKPETCEISNDMEKGKGTTCNVLMEMGKALKNDNFFDEEELKNLITKFKSEKKLILIKYLELSCELSIDPKMDLKEILLYVIKEGSPLAIFNNLDYYRSEPWVKDIVIEAGKDFPPYAFQEIDRYINEPWAKEVIIEVIKNLNNGKISSDEGTFDFNIFEYFEYFKDKSWASEVLKVSLDNLKLNCYNAFEYINYYKKEPWAKDTLRKSIEYIANEKNKDYGKIGQIINSLHEESDEIRFMIISKFDEKDLYKLITKGRSEVFTSTYNGVINRLLPKLKSSGKDIYDLAESNNFEGINTFIEASASYGRLDELFNTIGDIEKKKKLLDNMFDENKNTGLNNYVAIIEIINAFKDESLLKYIGEKVKEKSKNQSSKHTWLIIAKNCTNRFPNDEFFKNIDDKFKFIKMEEVDNKDLFNERGENIQQYYFYNDDDGKSSYDNFISNYKGKTDWNIEDKKSFVIIKSKTINGKSIIIYANKPENDGTNSKNPNGVDGIKTELKGQNPKVVVHRGHGYHTNKTIKNVTPESILVFLGSCGGFQYIENVLNKSENAQIISTKGTGVKIVNDTLFKIINEKILSGKDIIRENIWKEMEPKLGKNKDFKAYVRPDKNLGAMFYKVSNELKRKN